MLLSNQLDQASGRRRESYQARHQQFLAQPGRFSIAHAPGWIRPLFNILPLISHELIFDIGVTHAIGDLYSDAEDGLPFAQFDLERILEQDINK